MAQEKEKLESTLEDVQKEYLSLLRETQELQDAERSRAAVRDRIEELEETLAAKEDELQSAQKEQGRLAVHLQKLEADIAKEKLKEDEVMINTTNSMFILPSYSALRCSAECHQNKRQ